MLILIFPQTFILWEVSNIFYRYSFICSLGIRLRCQFFYSFSLTLCFVPTADIFISFSQNYIPQYSNTQAVVRISIYFKMFNQICKLIWRWLIHTHSTRHAVQCITWSISREMCLLKSGNVSKKLNVSKSSNQWRLKIIPFFPHSIDKTSVTFLWHVLKVSFSDVIFEWIC